MFPNNFCAWGCLGVAQTGQEIYCHGTEANIEIKINTLTGAEQIVHVETVQSNLAHEMTTQV